MGLAFGEEVPEYAVRADLRWMLARVTGWTLEYIDGLTLDDLWQFLSVLDGRAKGAESARRQSSATEAAKRRKRR